MDCTILGDFSLRSKLRGADLPPPTIFSSTPTNAAPRTLTARRAFTLLESA